MKKNVWNGIVLLAAVMAVLVLAGCPTEVAETPSGNAGIKSITINGITVPVPQGTARSVILGDSFKASDMDVADVLIPAADFDVNGDFTTEVKVSASGSDAAIWYLKVPGGLKPDLNDPAWSKTAPTVFKNKESLYIQVTSADKRSQSYYRVRINKINNVAEIQALFIGGKNTGITKIDGADDITVVVPTPVSLVFGEENINAVIDATKTEAMARLEYGILAEGDDIAAIEFKQPSAVNLDNGDTLYVKVIPTDPQADAWYYGVVINTTARITGVGIGGTNQAISANGVKDFSTVTPVTVNRVIETITTALGATTAGGVTVKYDLLSTDGEPSWKDLTAETTVTYTNNSFLYLQVNAFDFKPTYHKFNIILQSNNTAITSIKIGNTIADTVGTGAATANVGTNPATLRGAIVLKAADAAANSTVTVTFVNPNTRVTGFAVGTSAANVSAYTAATSDASGAFTKTTAMTTTNVSLSIRVMAEAGNLYYYRIIATVQSGDASITGISIAGRAASNVAATYGTAWNNAPVIDFLLGEQMVSNAALIINKANANSVMHWAYLATDSNPTASLIDTAPAPITLVTDNSVLYIRNVAQDGSDTRWYKLAIDVRSDNAKASDIVLNGVNIDEGEGAAAINVGTNPANLRGAGTLTTAKAIGTVPVTVHLYDDEADVTGYMVLASTTTPNAANLQTAGITQVGATTEWTIADVGSITSGQHLYIQVTAHDSSIWYYRIVVTVQSNNANLNSITIGGIAASDIGTPDDQLSGIVDGLVSIPASVLAAGDVTVAVGRGQANSVVTMAVTSGADPDPDADFTPLDEIPVLADHDTVWFKVVSQDGDVTNYYAVIVAVQSSNAELNLIDIGSVAASDIGTPGDTIGGVVKGSISIGADVLAAGDLTVVIGKVNPNAVVTMAKTDTATEPAVFTTIADISTLADTDVVWFKVVSQDGTSTKYYAVVVTEVP